MEDPEAEELVIEAERMKECVDWLVTTSEGRCEDNVPNRTARGNYGDKAIKRTPTLGVHIAYKRTRYITVSDPTLSLCTKKTVI